MGAKRELLVDRVRVLLERLDELEAAATQPIESVYQRQQRRKDLARTAINFSNTAHRYLGGRSGVR